MLFGLNRQPEDNDSDYSTDTINALNHDRTKFYRSHDLAQNSLIENVI